MTHSDCVGFTACTTDDTDENNDDFILEAEAPLAPLVVLSAAPYKEGWCHKGVTRVLQECYKGVTRVLQECYRRVTANHEVCELLRSLSWRR
jgi:hypothetical protein